MPGLRLYLTTDGTSYAVERDGRLLAEGLVVPTRNGAEITIEDRATPVDEPAAITLVLDQLLRLARQFELGPPRWVRTDPTPVHDAAADAAGLSSRRDLLQLRRPLPLGSDERAGVRSVTTRTFRSGEDDERWLTANNRSFASDPDQSGMRLEDLHRTTGQPWFDAAGFLLLDSPDRPGELDGFCWTKVHAAEEPPLGEIYVIGVDPAAQGQGLGPALTVAGLDHLAASGLGVGMLYVDAANLGALHMYERLGFATHERVRIYSLPPN